MQQTNAIPKTMLAARLHAVGQPMSLDTIPRRPGPTDILLQVKACGVVPNLRTSLTIGKLGFPTSHCPTCQRPLVLMQLAFRRGRRPRSPYRGR